MKISVLIPAYNEEKLLGKTLNAVTHQTRPPDEIIVLDAQSTDATAKIAESYRVTVLPLERKTISYSRQQGLLAAHSEVVAFVDADVVPHPDWLERIEHALTIKPIVGIFGTTRVYQDKAGIISRFYFNYVTQFTNVVLHKIGITLATGQNMAFYRQKALDAGGFPVEFKICEDWEIAKRLKKVGSIIYDPTLISNTSDRRGNEGIPYIIRYIKIMFFYFVLHRADVVGFPNIR